MYVVQYLESGWWFSWTKHPTRRDAEITMEWSKQEHPDIEFRVRRFNEEQEV